MLGGQYYGKSSNAASRPRQTFVLSEQSRVSNQQPGRLQGTCKRTAVYVQKLRKGSRQRKEPVQAGEVVGDK